MSDLAKYFGSRRKTAAIDSATAWKAYQVALASLDEGAATTAVEKAYQDALAQVTRNSRVAYANLTYTESVAQIGSVGDAITDMGQAGKTYITNLAGDEKAYTDTAAPIIGARTLLYTQADNNLRKAITTADNVWRNGTAQAWGTHTAGDLVARGAVRRTLAKTSSLLADASHASIAELKAQWWQNEIPNYLQWSVDIGGIETAYTNSTTANILLRATGIKTAGVAYASTVGTAIQAFETTTATAREQYLSTLMTVSETAAEATLRADRDKEIALTDADLQKQLTGNESAHTTAVNNANSAHSTATANAEAAYSTSRANAQAAHDAAMLDAMEDWQLSSRESLTDLLFTKGQSRETYNVAASNVYANWENRVGNLLGDKPEGTGWEEGMNLGGDENNQPRGPNNTPGNGFAAFVVWTPHEPEPPKKPQPIPPPPQQPQADDNIFSSPERPSIEKLQFLYDHFGKDRAEELIEMRWPSKPYPESKYSMSAYEPSNEERLAQGFPGYDRLRYLIDRYEAGDTDGRERDEMRQLATDFQFYWRVKNGSGGTLMGTAMMVTGLTVAGQNPKFNSFAGSASAVIAARPTPVRPNLRLEIRPRYTQQPVPSAPKTFTTKEPSGSPAPKFKMQPVAPPAPLDKLQTVAPKPKVDFSKYREINLGSEGEADKPDMLHLNIDLNNITRRISGGIVAANYTSMPEIPSSHFEVIRGRNVQFGMPSEIVPTVKEIFRIAKPGGKISISFTSNWDEVESALKEAGFVNVKRGARTSPFGLTFTAEKSN